MLCKAKNNNVNWREKVWNFLKFYNTDFVFVKDIYTSIVRPFLWERYWTKEFKGNLPTTVSDTLEALNELNPYSYPPIFEVLKIIAVFPSIYIMFLWTIVIIHLRHLKDHTQSKMKSDTLNDLASMDGPSVRPSVGR